MAKYVTSVRTQMSPESAFAYMADLRNFDEWDPGVSSVTQIDGDAPLDPALEHVVPHEPPDAAHHVVGLGDNGHMLPLEVVADGDQRTY